MKKTNNSWKICLLLFISLIPSIFIYNHYKLYFIDNAHDESFAPYHPPSQYEAIVRTSQYITTRDGTKLALDIYLPANLKKGIKLPVILEQTPFWRSLDLIKFSNKNIFSKDIVFYVKNGYSYVVADVRGSGASYGTVKDRISYTEMNDSYDIVQWIVNQPWSNGKVGTYGISITGTIAERTSIHPSVLAVVPVSAPLDLYRDLFAPAGILQKSFVMKLNSILKNLDSNNRSNLYPIDIRYRIKGVRPVDEDKNKTMLLEAVAEHKNKYPFTDLLEICNTNKEVNHYFKRKSSDILDYKEFFRRIKNKSTAIYSYSGWFDGGLSETAIERYHLSNENNRKLILGPWSHIGRWSISPTSIGFSKFDRKAEILRFFDYYLKDIDNGIHDEKPIHYFTMVEDKWKSSDVWPPKATNKMLFFSEDKSLVLTKSNSVNSFDTYQVQSDMGTGKKSRWDSLLGSDIVHYKDRKGLNRKILYYESDPLSSDIEVTGQPQVDIYLKSTVSDVTIFVYLEDVYPNGFVNLITEGILRSNKKNNDNQNIRELAINMYPTSYLFKKGHSFRISIAGTDKDHFCNSYRPPLPIFTILRTHNYPSKLILPIVE